MREPPLSAHDVFSRHLWAVFLACGFIGVFVVSVPMVYVVNASPNAEIGIFGALFAACHIANWPMLQLRWRLWFAGGLTPYAAMCTTALLLGSFGIPYILLVDLLHG